jgi:hypothetical protein
MMNTANRTWTVERAVPLLAGTMVLVSLALAIAFSGWWLLLTTFVALNLVFYSIAGWCPASLLMHRLGLPRQCDILQSADK